MARRRLATAALMLATFVWVAPARAADTDGIPAQTFVLDPSHTSILFSVSHIGLSEYTAGFDEVTATLNLDPANPANASLRATIRVGSLDLPDPPEGFSDLLLGPSWFDAAAHPAITFVSDSITLTSDTTARIDGTLTLLGNSGSLSLMARFNGAYPAKMLEQHARIGFSASGSFSRSAFGMGIGVPPAGSRLGVGDTVTLSIQAEFTGGADAP